MTEDLFAAHGISAKENCCSCHKLELEVDE
jgi:hypothetical protein